MFKNTRAFSSFSVDDLSEAKKFYGETLGLNVSEMSKMHLLNLHLPGGSEVMIYEKDDHVPATFTVLNFPVDDVEKTVKDLLDKGLRPEDYDQVMGTKSDENGIYRGKEAGNGPDIAWFKDPADNIFAVMSKE